MAIPDELHSGSGAFALTVQQGSTEILPGTVTPTRGVNGSFLGPTLRMRTGEQVRMTVRNDLPEVTTMHWHGMALPARMDGGPHQPIEPGESWQPTWTVENQPATLWYHPHVHGATAQQVFKGVAGMIIVEDERSDGAGLPHGYGVDDFPVMIMDRTIAEDGSMPFDTEPNFGQLGTDILVNGTMGAYLDLTRTTVRLRVLNASNARLYHLGFADDRQFSVVAADQGLLPSPVRLSRVRLGPGERVELLVEVEPGERVRLNTVGGSERLDAGDLDILELRVFADAKKVAAAGRFAGPDAITAPSGARVRRFDLQGHDSINGQEMDLTRIDEVVPAGAVEIWEIENTVYAHNFHIHGCELTVLDRNGAPPESWEAGLKDTVHLPPRSKARLAVRFGRHTDPTSPYMYHCHILRHEDSGMMGQFVVVEPGTEGSVPRTVPMAPGGDGHQHG